MQPRSKKVNWVKIAVVIITAIGFYGTVLALNVYFYSFISDTEPADAAIVLGAEVWNGRPSPVFEERIKHAINLYKTKQVKILIFTGGVGENDQLAESIVAKEFALRAGIPEKNIFCETESKITVENLQGAKEIVKSLGLQRVLLVSDPIHMRRSVLLAQDLGMNAYPSPTPTTRYTGFITRMEFLLRETYLFGLYLFQRLF